MRPAQGPCAEQETQMGFSFIERNVSEQCCLTQVDTASASAPEGRKALWDSRLPGGTGAPCLKSLSNMALRPT